jgi:Tfp pilus assembly protein PilN
MRPVNLIPVEERRGTRRPMRGGPLAYMVLGALLAALAGVTLLVVADNQISTRTAEVAELKTQTAAAEAQANRLAPYTQFHAVSSQRTQTVSNLADSRFDWEKVMRELALVLPDDVTLTNLTGSVRPGVSVGGGEEVSLRASVAGPALSMVGCASGQEAVARFVTVLKDIDGVTRVGLQSSQLPSGASGGESGGGSVSASGGCQGGKSDARFQIVVAFDAAPVAAAATSVTEVAAAAPEEAAAPEASAESSTTAAEGE